jgi:hypothetical protein
MPKNLQNPWKIAIFPKATAAALRHQNDFRALEATSENHRN